QMFYGCSNKLFMVFQLDLCSAQIERERERERERELTLFERLETHGIPIGNLTSQIFANIYLNELDRFVKHKLKEKYYLRYCDDFVILSGSQQHLEKLIEILREFLDSTLKLDLHEHKIIIRKLRQGIDFLGYVVLPNHIILRTKTKKRMLKRVNYINLASYFGLLKHCEGYELHKKLLQKVKNSEN
ncbi:RNA-directed DNA polymerase, partial [Patescibacteria group bacterium]